MCTIFENNCKYPNCAKVFSTLPDLITHIEQDHLDFSAERVRQLEDETPECLPLSYVLKFSKYDAPPPQFAFKNERLHTFSEPVMFESFGIPFDGCDFKDKRLVHDSNKLRLNEEYSSTTCKNRMLFTTDNNHKKPFVCKMPGCGKRYKNLNGMKNHFKKYHKLDDPAATVKRSVLKYNNSAMSHVKFKVENRRESQSLPLIGASQPTASQFGNGLVYHDISALTKHREGSGAASQLGFLSFNNVLPTSSHVNALDQVVPLQTMSFNDYPGDIGDSATATSSHDCTKY